MKCSVMLKVILFYMAMCRRSSKKSKPNNDDIHGHGQKRRRPPTYVEGKKNTLSVQWASMVKNISLSKRINMFEPRTYHFREGKTCSNQKHIIFKAGTYV